MNEKHDAGTTTALLARRQCYETHLSLAYAYIEQKNSFLTSVGDFHVRNVHVFFVCLELMCRFFQTLVLLVRLVVVRAAGTFFLSAAA